MSHLAASRLFNLEGAVSLVTGGGTGIGLMCSRALAANGAKVYITGRREGKLASTASDHSGKVQGEIIGIQGDVTNKEDLKRIAEELKQKEGKLHILINNAGIAGPKTKFDDHSKVTTEEYSSAHLQSEAFEGWNEVFNTNVSAVFFATMSMLPLLEAGNKQPPKQWEGNNFNKWNSAVINVTSISGIVKANQNHFAYNASKGAANHLTSMLAHELKYHAPFQLRVNAIAPGVFPSEMTANTSGNEPETGANVTSVDTEGLQDMAGPPERTGSEEDMANLCLMLATNSYVHGQIVAIDGGFTSAVPSTR